jgi:methylated-DNA-[protein]-cysteine S-methyltransferase
VARAAFTRYAVPEWGTGELWTRDATVLAHDFRFGAPTHDAPLGREAEGELPARFAAFLSGTADDFLDVAIDLAWTTRFQRAVAEALRRIRRGEVVTYGELAALAGRPRAARAVGTFCAENRFAFVVPCHRVVAASGVGAYGSAGVEVKRRLLALDGIVL